MELRKWSGWRAGAPRLTTAMGVGDFEWWRTSSRTSLQDAGTYASVTALFAGVALPASYLPARRATAIDPLSALRHD